MLDAVRRICGWAAALCLLALAGCRSPGDYRRQADDAAARIIEEHQQKQFGRTNAIEVRTPEETLRRRLLLDQDLPTGFAGSQGSSAVAPIPQLRGDEYLTAPRPAPAASVPAASNETLVITLEQALQIAARESREYQTEKERVFIAALDLDLERDAFRNSWGSFLTSAVDYDPKADEADWTAEHEGGLKLARQFAGGMLMTAQLGLNLVQLLSGGGGSASGIFGDASVSLPLLRGAGRFVVTEPLTQAQRNVVYALYTFERFKQSFVVGVASDYLGVEEALDRVRNAEENYRGLATAARRARRLADMGRLPEIQVDQAAQDELRARDRWVSARQDYESSLDAFKVRLGLPADATLALDAAELSRLSAEVKARFPAPETRVAPTSSVPADAEITLEAPSQTGGGPLEMDSRRAVEVAVNRRLDFRVAIGRIDDAQRAVAIAADSLRADMTLLGAVSGGERRTRADILASDTEFDFKGGSLEADLGLPLERTAERNKYRTGWIEFERAVREAQRMEDGIKSDVRNGLRTLIEAREAVNIQTRAAEVALRRVHSTELFLQLGRAEIRDVLDARESLISAENALTSAIVRYRVAELELQRDLGVLEVAADGLWREFDPTQLNEVQRGI